jgi:hypothetical protein
MKTLLTLVVAALVLNAAVRGATATWSHYRFIDEAQEILTFGAAQSPAELHADILEVAARRGIPLTSAALSVTRNSSRTIATGTYSRVIELVPTYPYTATLSFEVDALLLGAAPLDGRPRN